MPTASTVVALALGHALAVALARRFTVLGYDIDSRRIAENARLAGVQATLRIWHGAPHGWQIFAPILPEARDALREAAAFIRARLA